MYKRSWKHRVRADEILPVDSAARSDRTGYTILVEDTRIDDSGWNEVYVRAADGWEPAAGFSRHGVGSVFTEIAFDNGRVRMEFADHANQRVRNPRGMRLRFYVRPTLEELLAE